MIDPSGLVPIPRQLRALLLDRIASGEYPPGQRLASERSLSKQYGVSRTSVREAITQLLAEGTLTRSGRGTFVAGRAEKPAAASRQIGFWINSAIFGFVQPGYNRILIAAGEACRSRDYRLQFHAVNETKQSLDAVFAGDDLTGGLAGNLVVGGLNRPALQRLGELPCPVQFVDLLVSDEDLDSVRIDYASGTRQAIEHLKSLGHEDVGFIGFPGSEKYEAYWQSLEVCGLRYNPRSVQLLSVSDLLPGIMAGYRSTQKLIGGKRLPTALLVTNDYVALGVMEALAIAGIQAPEQISIVGCDDLELGARPLTTIHVDLGEVGRLAANALLDRIENGAAGSKQLVVPVKLIVRETTAPPEHRLPGISTFSAGSTGAVRP